MVTQLSDFDKQEIRIAVVMTGGVSLAIWTSGVAVELLRLTQASLGVSSAPREYGQILDLLQTKAKVDVITGTSAGGLSGAFLALCLAQDCELTGLRDLWRDAGGLDRLLRDPIRKDIPSLLDGEYFHDSVRGALEKVLKSRSPAPPAATGNDVKRVELLLTGTLWDGRRSSFTDDMDASITEVDHDATFRFSTVEVPSSKCGDLTAPGVVQELAVAARCSSSFPGAFEPFLVTVEPGGCGPDGRYPSAAGRANFAESQFVVDGGLLLNKPLRPALEAIYRQPAELQVRRLLTYVVPDPAEPAEERPPNDKPVTAAEQRAAPDARRVLLNVVTRLRSTDSVSRELGEIRSRNDAVTARRQARSRLAAAMRSTARSLSEQAWDAYKETRKEDAARSIGHYLAQGQPASDVAWSEQEIVESLREQKMEFIPCAEHLAQALGLPGEDWNWGHSTVFRLGEMTIDTLKRAVWLAEVGSQDREQIVRCRDEIHGVLAKIRADAQSLHHYWFGAPRGKAYDITPMPPRIVDARRSALNRAALAAWLAGVLHVWDIKRPELETVASDAKLRAGRVRLYEQACDLAKGLRSCRQAIANVCVRPNAALARPEDPEVQQLLALHDCLLGAAGSDIAVLQNMLRLEVVEVAFGPAIADVEQQVELIQVSAGERDHLTGIQAYHFGAFYRPSWRMNDWMHGRMDAVNNLVRVLLSPERIRQLGERAPKIDDVEAIVLGRPSDPRDEDPDKDYWAKLWAREKDACRDELRSLAGARPFPKTLPACADVLARRLQTQVLREDLKALADAIAKERPDTPRRSEQWLQSYLDAEKARGGAALSASTLWSLWEASKTQIGSRRLRDEVGSDTFARTVAQATSVVANAVGSPDRPRAIATVFAAVRGYALTVWALVHFMTLGSSVGRHVVELALAAGGVLLAVAVVVPGIPAGLTFAGVVLLFGGLTVAALRTPFAEPQGLEGVDTGQTASPAAAGAAAATEASGGRLARARRRLARARRRLVGAVLALRLAVVFVVALTILVVSVARDIADNGWQSTTWTLALKAGIVVVVALAGIWVAGAQRSARRPRPSDAPQAPTEHAAG